MAFNWINKECSICHRWHWPHERCSPREDERPKGIQDTSPQRVGVLYDLRMSLAQGGSHAG